MWKRWLAWLQADDMARNLAQLDDRLLADMGLERRGLRARLAGQPADAAAPGSESVERQGDAAIDACLAVRPQPC